jgi:HK97 family phage prohead protease
MENKERRFGNIELRKKDDGSEGRTIRGYAAVYNKDSEDFGYFTERIAPGAFKDVMNDDVVALFNHDPNLPLARSGAGLTIGSDDTGLYYEFDAPNTTIGNDLLANVRSGVIKQSSFAFTVKEEKWLERKGQSALRTITKVERLYDVSPVTYPAYPDTTVATRALSKLTNGYQNDLAEMDLDRMRLDLRK